MIPVKDARELLYTMYRSNWVRLQEVARTPDVSNAKKIYLWSTDVEAVRTVAAKEMVETMCKLLARLDQEQVTARSLLGVGGEVGAMRGEQRKRWDAVHVGIERLQGALLRLDEVRSSPSPSSLSPRCWTALLEAFSHEPLTDAPSPHARCSHPPTQTCMTVREF